MTIISVVANGGVGSMKQFTLENVLAGLSGTAIKQAYTAIYEAGVLSGRGLNERLRNDKAHSRIAELRKLGLIENAGRRRDPLTGKSVDTWRVTGNLPTKRNLSKVVRPQPTARELREFVEQFAVLRARAGQSGARVSPEVRKVHEWLLAGAPCGHTN